MIARSLRVRYRLRWAFRTVLLGIIACAVVAAGLADGAAAQTVRVGVRAGPTFGFLNDSATPFVSADDAGAHPNVRLDLHAGAYAIFPLADHYGLQTELLYIRKGGHLSRFENAGQRVERYRLAYGQAQVLARRDISLPGPLRLHVLGGVTGGRLLGGTVRRTVQTEIRVYRETINLTSRRLVRHWDVGALVGIGLGYPVGKAGQISLDLRYNRGFRSVFTDRARPLTEQMTGFEDPPPLTRRPPTLRHDAVTASLSFTTALSR